MALSTRLRHGAFLFLLLFLGCPSWAQTVTPQLATPQQWTTEMAAFAHQDSLTPPPTKGIVFTGSSSVRKWETLATDLAGHPVLNRGFGGSRFPDANFYFEQLVLKYRPRQVFLYEGDNDLAAGATPEQVYESFRAFEKRLRHDLPKTDLVFISIKPSLARWALWPQMQSANNMIKSYIQKHPKRLHFLDVGTAMLGPDGKPRPELYVEDGLHMTRAGYDIWTRLVTPYLAK
ncbi:SGNH/GDSL hydrolase family protein [Hymenobacter jejuensis]|uniref:SGNH hydrolase-type esterase domain-containing protein n=1 Tax=Hymenobacter jejuensis TaxID=2502781 RepID=A0A5B7ZX44_9BACT|nr:SGNH/GDSL hydrolase family protein [Hymenobacter jejuensis]QDA59684.1 hypothetical protein FHG12_06005 [Hymenobacter jejuensis]